MAPLSTRGFNSSTGRSGGIRWSPDLSKFASVIKDLRDPIYDEAYNRLAPFPSLMSQWAKTNHPWKNRSSLAEHGLSARRRRGAHYLSLTLTHSPHTTHRGFNYGMFLEGAIYSGGQKSAEELELDRKFGAIPGSEVPTVRTYEGFDMGHGTLAVILPTIEEFQDEILPAMKGILNAAVRKQL